MRSGQVEANSKKGTGQRFGYNSLMKTLASILVLLCVGTAHGQYRQRVQPPLNQCQAIALWNYQRAVSISALNQEMIREMNFRRMEIQLRSIEAANQRTMTTPSRPVQPVNVLRTVPGP
jgi:hypothetical protein